MNENETVHTILGFNFYITWDGDEGVDQRGVKWTNRENPVPENQELVDIALDTYNKIMKM